MKPAGGGAPIGASPIRRSSMSRQIRPCHRHHAIPRELSAFRPRQQYARHNGDGADCLAVQSAGDSRLPEDRSDSGFFVRPAPKAAPSWYKVASTGCGNTAAFSVTHGPLGDDRLRERPHHRPGRTHCTGIGRSTDLVRTGHAAPESAVSRDGRSRAANRPRPGTWPAARPLMQDPDPGQRPAGLVPAPAA